MKMKRTQFTVLINALAKSQTKVVKAVASHLEKQALQVIN